RAWPGWWARTRSRSSLPRRRRCNRECRFEPLSHRSLPAAGDVAPHVVIVVPRAVLGGRSHGAGILPAALDFDLGFVRLAVVERHAFLHIRDERGIVDDSLNTK